MLPVETGARVLVTGAGGQLGRELVATQPTAIALHALSRRELDVTDLAQVHERVSAVLPDVVVNAAAFTQVDLAESQPDEAFAVNASGSHNLAAACAESGARLIQVSTDFVFDGTAKTPYRPEDPTGPLCVYGETKLAGERKVREVLPERSLIVRSSWLYSIHGANFVKTMLRVFSERDVVRVVTDQTGCPTWTRNLARALWAWVALPDAVGLRHWSDRGGVTWYQFAEAIRAEAIGLGLLEDPGRLEPIATAEFAAEARRPAFSVLDTIGSEKELALVASDWRQSLKEMLSMMATDHDTEGLGKDSKDAG